MKRILSVLLILFLAAIGPNIFPAAQAGYSTLHLLAVRLLLPSILALVVLTVILGKRQRELSRLIIFGGAAGALATVSLEVVRLLGFHFDFMPGNLPRLMGVLLLDRFAEGPSILSDVAGWAYHFWNGAAFGMIYTVVFGTKRRWVGALYGIALGVGFMTSPVVTSLGVGAFGLQFSYGFPITVVLAHLAFGWALGVLAQTLLGGRTGLVIAEMRRCILPAQSSRQVTISR